jgi:hypothetical protein
VGLTSIGLEEGVNTDFDFYVVSYSRDAENYVDISNWMSYDAVHQAFNTVDTVNTEMPLWFDAAIYSPTFDIAYDKSSMIVGETKNLLLLHLFNTAGSTAEVVPVNVTPLVFYLPIIIR